VRFCFYGVLYVFNKTATDCPKIASDERQREKYQENPLFIVKYSRAAVFSALQTGTVHYCAALRPHRCFNTCVSSSFDKQFLSGYSWLLLQG